MKLILNHLFGFNKILPSSISFLSLLILLFFSGVIAPLPVYSRSLTIDQAISMALENNIGYLVAKSETEKADADIKKAVAGALPQLDLSSMLTRNFEVPEIVFAGERFKLGTDNSANISLAVTQSLYKGGKVFSALKISRLYRKYVDEMVREVEGGIIYTVRQAFLGAVLARNVVKVYQDAVATAELNLQLTTKMHEQGVVSEFEQLRAEVELANLRPQLIQAENLTVIAQDYLKNLIGLQLHDSLELIYEFNDHRIGRDLNLEQLQQVALGNRAAIKQQGYMEEMRKKAIGIAKAGHRPNLSLQSAIGWSYQADNFGFAKDNWTRDISASLLLSMPIFDGFATASEVRKARVDHHTAKLLLEDQRQQVELEVRSSYLTYMAVADRLAAQVKTVQQAEEGLRIARLRYESGVGTQLEVLSAESALTQAKTNYVQVTHDAALAVFILLRVTGVDSFDGLEEK